jgi:methyl-accepting chemotaxis protein
MIEGFTNLETKIVETSKLIDDVTNAAKEQSIGMAQIADAVGQLDKFTQENAAVADKTNDIAQITNEIAIDIVNNVNLNNFEGKGKSVNVVKKEQTTSTKKVTQTLKPTDKKISEQNSSQKTKVITPQKSIDNDEWESF